MLVVSRVIFFRAISPAQQKTPNTVCSGQRLRRSKYAPRASEVVFRRRCLARPAAAAKTNRWVAPPEQHNVFGLAFGLTL
jgi:hypothetical protein